MVSPPCACHQLAAGHLFLVLLALNLLSTNGVKEKSAETVTVTVKGVTYEITPSPPTSVSKILSSLKSTPWFGKQALAEALALQVKSSLGLPGEGGIGGPIFLYNSAYQGTAYYPSIPGLDYYGGIPANMDGLVFALGKVQEPLEQWRAFDPVTSSVIWVPQVSNPPSTSYHTYAVLPWIGQGKGEALYICAQR